MDAPVSRSAFSGRLRLAWQVTAADSEREPAAAGKGRARLSGLARHGFFRKDYMQNNRIITMSSSIPSLFASVESSWIRTRQAHCRLVLLTSGRHNRCLVSASMRPASWRAWALESSRTLDTQDTHVHEPILAYTRWRDLKFLRSSNANVKEYGPLSQPGAGSATQGVGNKTRACVPVSKRLQMNVTSLVIFRSLFSLPQLFVYLEYTHAIALSW